MASTTGTIFTCPQVFPAGALSQIRQKSFNVLTRSIKQTLFRKKTDKSLRPLDIKERTIRPPADVLQTSRR